MVNIDLHKTTLIKILKEIYSDPNLRTSLGFKGGTAALLFYDLPRFSVDIDFDLLDSDKKEVIFERLKKILPQFGILKQAVDKKFTLFFLLSYQDGERVLKVEISKRAESSKFETKNYLGIPMLVMVKEDLIASKLSALLTRNRFAARDLFDLWFFLKNNWSINEQVVKEKTGLTLKVALNKAEKRVSEVKKTNLLSGLGDLLDHKQKAFVKEKLQDELVFLLKLTINAI